MTRWDAIIIGGGLAGSAAAIQLARAGKNILLLEKEAHAHHKVCGEFLSYEALHYLKALSLDFIALGAVPIHTLQLACAGDNITAPLPFQGMSISRRILDEALLQKAADNGVAIMRGVTVSDAASLENGWSVSTSNASYAANAVLLATGKRDLRAFPREKGTQNDYIGFKMHWKLSPEATQQLQGKVCIIWFNGGYAGLELVEQGVTNFCLVVTKQRFRETGKEWELLLKAIRAEVLALDTYLTGATPYWQKPLAVFGIPYGYVKHSKAANGFYHLGDQLAVIPSFSGDGMAIALYSAARVVESIVGNNPNYHATMHRQLQAQIRIASFVSRITAHRLGQKMAFTVCKHFPQLLSLIARKTRLAYGP